MGLTKLILSHKRADRIITHKAVKGFSICIPESQLEEYKKFNPNESYVTHPDSIVGLSPKRQWVYDNFGDVFMIDDDVTNFQRLYPKDQSEKSYVLTPEEATGLIEDTYHIAKEAGFFLFGFNRSNHPKAYHGNQPIMLNAFITGGAFGIIKGSKIFFPDWPEFVGEDYFLNAINLYYHRRAWVDRRFAVSFKDTEHGVGGCADYRTEQRRKETYIYLKKCFGSCIQPKQKSPIKKNFNKWEKRLVFPF